MGKEPLSSSSSSSLLVPVLGAVWDRSGWWGALGHWWLLLKTPVAAGLSLPGTVSYALGGGPPPKIPCPWGSAVPAGTRCFAGRCSL